MMARLACVDVPFFSLQVLLRGRPEWRDLPSAVVDRDEATGKILTINEAAQAKGIRPGMSYSQALSLAGDLRAAAVTSELLEAARRELLEELCTFSPEVEPCRLDPVNGNKRGRRGGREGSGPGRGRSRAGEDMGAFWLNAAGLGRIYPTLSSWMNGVVAELQERGFFSVVAVGFTRFGSYVLARDRRKSIVLSSEAQEEELMRRGSLRVLPLSVQSLELLRRLGVETVGAFLDLPEAGVAKRFGREVHEIFTWAQHERLPIQPATVEKNATVTRRFDDPLRNLAILIASLDELLTDLLATVIERQRLLAAVTVELAEGEEMRAREEIRPASPSRDLGTLKALCRLRLSEHHYDGPVDCITLTAEEITPIHSNGDLFASPRSQASEAGKRALALIRARFGNDSVRHAVLRDEHLPEERYVWDAVGELPFPAPGALDARGGQGGAGMQRRFHVVRRLVEERTSSPDRASPPRSVSPVPEPFRPIAGPFVVTGKWWLREERREYYFAWSTRGGLVWLYRDGASGSWIVQGQVD